MADVDPHKRAVESPFRGLAGANAILNLGKREIMRQAEEQFKRYEERISNQYAAITRLLEHHNKTHPDCNFEDLDQSAERPALTGNEQ